jgi:hypothetical protein
MADGGAGRCGDATASGGAPAKKALGVHQSMRGQRQDVQR